VDRSPLKQRLSISVRTLVDATVRSGDLDLRFAASGRSLEGIRAHQRIQRSRPPTYRAEVPVSIDVMTGDAVVTVGGRIDGVFENPDGVIVEEIKSTTRPLAEVTAAADPCHWAQVKVYAHLLAQARSLEALTVRLTYCHLESGETLEQDKWLTRDKLAAFFHGVVERYVRWASLLTRWRIQRDASIHVLDFPFGTYRPGQRKMAVDVYRTVRDGAQLLITAATGIGKTMAALFPAIKTIADGATERIFFLTARNTGKQAAIDALELLQREGLHLKWVSLTAKDRICFCSDAACNPDECAYARGYFDRLWAAMETAFAHDALGRQTIEAVARSHRVCPFEFSLALARWADCIVADYNYAFDPRVYLKRFFDDELGAYAFLIDEAHNLVDRSRDMFSARLNKRAFLELRRAVKSRLPDVYRAAGKINRWMVTARKRTDEAGGFDSENRLPDGLEALLRAFVRVTEKWLATNQPAPYRDIVLDRFFEVGGFLRVWEQFDGSYVTCYRSTDADLDITLYCLDPSDHLKRALQRTRSAVFFSATLTPGDYFRDILGCHRRAPTVTLPSPFPPDHLAVFVAHTIPTFYRQRRHSLDPLVSLIRGFVATRNGNYLCFFPSYEYMAMAVDRFEALAGNTRTVVQSRDMGDDERAAFLGEFDAEHGGVLVGFAVMGGIFGEGIDLVGDRLTGAIIVGVGLPGICPERDLIREHFDRRGCGFDVAYRFPGINRVLQAAGRVIRSPRDRGAILLIDPRFNRSDYRCLLPDHWSPTPIGGTRSMTAALKRFWECGDSSGNKRG
jgi:DNA excision repair protein ERCC-2